MTGATHNFKLMIIDINPNESRVMYDLVCLFSGTGPL